MVGRLAAIGTPSAVFALILAGACGGPSADGESCTSDGDCASKHCADGACRGSACTCFSSPGMVCRTDTGCESGWACVASERICHRTCADGGTCPASEHCGKDDVCLYGP